MSAGDANRDAAGAAEGKPGVRLAATVLLLRDAPRGVEVFMEKRHIQSDFVGGAYVFPGGAVDPEDRIDEELCAGTTDRAASARLGLDHGGLAFYVAAIRECFEEAGVLLAYYPGGALLDWSDPAVEERYRAAREQMNRGELTLTDLARRERLRLATDHIEYWAHWITPAGQPRRYDTRFFAARAPENQTAGHDDWELTSSAWVTAEEALERAAAHEWMIIFPTIKNLMLLSRFATAEAALADRRGCASFPVNQPKVLQPEVMGESERWRVVLPGDPGYELAADHDPAAPANIWVDWIDEYRRLQASGELGQSR